MTATLEAAMREEPREPQVTVVVSDQLAEVPRWEWTEIYAGGADGDHGLVQMASGSLVRARRGAAGEVFVQKITDPAAAGQWSAWTELKPAGTALATTGIALAARAGEERVRLFWVLASDGRTVKCAESTDGWSWDEQTVTVEASPASLVAMSAAENHLVYAFDAAAGGADHVLVAYEKVGGAWTNRRVLSAPRWPINGLGAAKDPASGVIYVVVADAEGTGGSERRLSVQEFDASTNAWGTGYTLVKHGAASGYDFKKPRLRLATAAVPRNTFTWVESWAGSVHSPAYERPMVCVTPRRDWLTEWVPWDVSTGHGLELLPAESGLWYLALANRAYSSPSYTGASGQRIDVSTDVAELQIDGPHLHRPTTGKVVLRNGAGTYAQTGASGPARCLRQGSQVAIKLGFRTAAGIEGVWQEPFWVDTVYHGIDGREATLELRFSDGWAALERLRPPLTVQFPASTTVGHVLDRALWRVTGVATTGPSGLATGLSNAVWQPGRAYADVVRRLCQIGRVVLRFRTAQGEADGSGLGSVATSTIDAGAQAATYTYGADHAITAGRIGVGGQTVNHVTAQGSRAGPYLAEAHDHAAIRRGWRRITAAFTDLRLNSQADAQAGADGVLRDAQRMRAAGWIEVPLNPGQEVGDTIAITDARLGLENATFVVGGKHVVWSRVPRLRAEMRLVLVAA